MTQHRKKPPGKGPPPGQFDAGHFAAYPIYAHAAALVVCAGLIPGVLAKGEPGPVESLYLAASLFGVGLMAAVWAGYSNRVFKLRAGSLWAGLNFIVPFLLSSVLLLMGALFGLALASAGVGVEP